jgi:hypothetical protein
MKHRTGENSSRDTVGHAATPPPETWSDPDRGTGELGAEQADPKSLPTGDSSVDAHPRPGGRQTDADA